MPDTTTPTDLTAGFRCPLCGVSGEDTAIRLNLDDCESFCCGDCNEEFTVADIEAQITVGKRLIAMAASAKAAGLSALTTDKE